MLKLNLPEFNFNIRQSEEKLKIFDPVRKQYLVLTPEEWVRQNFLQYLIEYKNVPLKMIRIEMGIEYNTLSKRPDIVCFNKNGSVWLLVECKASTVKLDDKVLMQLSSYYSKLNADYLCITNGLQHFYWSMTGKGMKGVIELPEYPVTPL